MGAARGRRQDAHGDGGKRTAIDGSDAQIIAFARHLLGEQGRDQ